LDQIKSENGAAFRGDSWGGVASFIISQISLFSSEML
jgi:hypothetical protein